MQLAAAQLEAEAPDQEARQDTIIVTGPKMRDRCRILPKVSRS